MNARLLLHTVVMFVLNDGLRTDFPLINYQDLFVSSVFLVSFESSRFPVIRVFPENENRSRSKCGNDSVTLSTSSSHDLDSISTDEILEDTESGGTLNQEQNGRFEGRQETTLPQLSGRLLNTRIQTGLVVFRSHQIGGDVEKQRSSMYPLTIINVYVPRPTEMTGLQKDANVLKAQRTNILKAGGVETFPKTDGYGFGSLPWNTLWILQEFRALKVFSNHLYKKSAGSEDLQSPNHDVKKRSEDHDLAVVPWQTLWLLQSDRTECSFPGKVLRIGSSLKDIEMNEWLRPNPEESLGNCPVRFRPLVDPYRWLPRNLVETECVCEGSPCARMGLHVCVTVYAARTVYSLRGGKRRLLIAVGCLCAIQKTRLANSVAPKTVD